MRINDTHFSFGNYGEAKQIIKLRKNGRSIAPGTSTHKHKHTLIRWIITN